MTRSYNYEHKALDKSCKEQVSLEEVFEQAKTSKFNMKKCHLNHRDIKSTDNMKIRIKIEQALTMKSKEERSQIRF